MMRTQERTYRRLFLHRSIIAAIFVSVVVGVVSLNARATEFFYPMITDSILSASFSADVAAFTAHRYVLSFEVNSLRLEGLVAGTPTFLDLSNILFGTGDAFVGPAAIDQGTLTTGIITVPIAPSFFPAL